MSNNKQKETNIESNIETNINCEQTVLNEGENKCKFCDEILCYGFDSNQLMHCQGCHTVWDGNAQCPCWFIVE